MAERQRWRPVLFDCPQTGHKVQGLLPEEVSSTDDVRYESVPCLACSGIHFVHPVSGKVLGATRGGAM